MLDHDPCGRPQRAWRRIIAILRGITALPRPVPGPAWHPARAYLPPDAGGSQDCTAMAQVAHPARRRAWLVRAHDSFHLEIHDLRTGLPWLALGGSCHLAAAGCRPSRSRWIIAAQASAHPCDQDRSSQRRPVPTPAIKIVHRSAGRCPPLRSRWIIPAQVTSHLRDLVSSSRRRPVPTSASKMGHPARVIAHRSDRDRLRRPRPLPPSTTTMHHPERTNGWPERPSPVLSEQPSR
jgi:hypothetical protein